MVPVIGVRVLDILGNIDDDRSPAAGGGHIHRFMDRFFDIVYGQGHVRLLGQGHHHADHITFLKSIRCNDAGGNLPGYSQHRNRIHHGIGNAGDKIHSTRTRCRHADTDSRVGGRNRGPRYSLRHKNSPLFMPRHDKREDFLLFHFVKYRHDGTAGISENIFNAPVRQRFQG